MTPAERFGLAMSAEQRVSSWSAGAQMLALVTDLRDRGWLRFLAEPRDVAELAKFAVLAPDRVRDVLSVLSDVVTVDGDKVRLTPEFGAFAADDAFIALDDVLDNAQVMVRAAKADVPPLSYVDALAVARAAGGRVGDVSRFLYEHVLAAQVPEIPARIRAGRWLDIGCGIAGATLTFATLYPELRATAIELIPLVADEARQRAEALGVSDRVEIRSMDAREFDERNAFSGVFWAQPFFPESARQATLAAILRALEPGGLLMMQEMESAPAEPDLSYDLRRLAYRGWGVPFARTAEDLVAEAAGFDLVRIAVTDLGRLVVVRKPVS